MEATLSADRLKTLQAALTCLSKLGVVLNLHATRSPRTAGAADQPDGKLNYHTTVRLSAINSSASAFCAFTFAEDFFELIRLRPSTKPSSSSEHTAYKLECQVSIRSLLASLKVSSAQRRLEKCEIIVTDEGQCRISIKLHQQDGVTKTHRLTYESQSALFPSANPDPGCAIVVSAQAALEWLQHFVSTGRGADVTICASPTDCSVRSKSDDYETGKTRKSIQTEIKVELTEFQLYHVPDPIYLTFPMKEFRASVVMAESLAAPVELHFSQSGEPLFVRVYSEAMNSELVIATSEEKGPPTQTQKASSKSDGAAPPDPEPEMPTSAAVPSRRAAQNNNGPEAAPERSTSLSRHGSPQVSSNHAPAPHVDTEPQTSEAREAAGPLESSQPPASIPQAHTESFPRESTPRQGLLPQSVQASPKLTAVRRMLDSPPERGNAELQPPPSQDDGANDLFLGGVLSQTSQEAPNEAAKRSVQSQYIAHTGRPLSRQNSESNRQRQQQSEPPRKVSASKAQPTDATMQRLDGGIWRAEESIELSIPKHLLEDQRDRRGDHEGARHSVAAREQHTFDVTEDTFDYSQAMDEMERGIEAGSIPVHGASQALGKRSIDEREENAGSVNASKSKDDADDEDDEMLPATQVASQASEAMALSRATRAHPSPQPDLVSSAAVPTPLVTATATPTEREQQQQQRKKFKPMF